MPLTGKFKKEVLVSREYSKAKVGHSYLSLEQSENCSDFSVSIPEARMNLVYASKESTSSEDVLTVDGRITVVGKLPKAAGKIKLGVSGYMASLILEIRTEP